MPLAVLSAPATEVPGWADLPPRAPAWWSAEVLPEPAAPGEAPPLPTPRQPRAPQPALDERQAQLFGKPKATTPPAATTPQRPATWVDSLLASDLFREQRAKASRQPMPDERIRVLLAALEEHGGTLTRTALARRIGVQEVRLPGILATVRKLLNVDGYAVLSVDESGESISMNRELLFVQFGLRGK